MVPAFCPCCFAVIGHLRTSCSARLLCSVWTAECAHQPKKYPHVVPSSSASEKPLVWILSFLTLSFDLFFPSYYFNLCPLVLWVYLNFFCQPFCSGFVLFGSPPASASSAAFSIGVCHHIWMSISFEKPVGGWGVALLVECLPTMHAQGPGFNPNSHINQPST